jgi:hypothetical protein
MPLPDPIAHLISHIKAAHFSKWFYWLDEFDINPTPVGVVAIDDKTLRGA